MAELPTYEEATIRKEWLELVAPYAGFEDYRALSCVNRRCWDIFAPLLWGNPLQTVRRAGLDPSDDIEWWFDFVFNKLGSVRITVRSLVRVLDLTAFAKDSYHFASDQNERTLQQSCVKALQLLPSIGFLLVDGHPDVNISLLVGERSSVSNRSLVLLSGAECPYQLPNNFFLSPIFQSLVYLDVSGIPGSIKALSQIGTLPNLAVLKLRNRELDDVALGTIAGKYGRRIWSLDISHNRVTDNGAAQLLQTCFSTKNLRTSGYFYTEGKLVPDQRGDGEYGPFLRVQESRWSVDFSHPERYLVDSPLYVADEDTIGQEYRVFRAAGNEVVRGDQASALTETVNLSALSNSPAAVRAPSGITHLNISETSITSAGFGRLMRTSRGHLECLTCDSLRLLDLRTTTRVWPHHSSLYGMAGGADYFRPVFASNLRSLRIHHSLITEVLDLEVEGVSSLARIYLSEQTLLPRVWELYRGAFIPDMNPRLTSLVLTNIPRRSTGPLVDHLIRFLKLLSEQEQSIAETAEALGSSRRMPAILRGLRHVRFEFRPDPLEEGYSTAEDLDAEELMNSGNQGFSFFEGEQYEKAPSVVRHGPPTDLAEGRRETNDDSVTSASTNDRGLDSITQELEYMTHECSWNGEIFKIQVWLGHKRPRAGSAMARYRHLVVASNVKSCVGPASPAQVRAGAPQNSYIFHTAWTLAIMPQELSSPPKAELARMKDVLQELKAYRTKGRASYMGLQGKQLNRQVPPGKPHYFWTGKLEVSTAVPMPHQSSAQYWR